MMYKKTTWEVIYSLNRSEEGKLFKVTPRNNFLFPGEYLLKINKEKSEARWLGKDRDSSSEP